MTDFTDEFKKYTKEYAELYMSTPEDVVKTMQRLGIYDENGDIHENYGGKDNANMLDEKNIFKIQKLGKLINQLVYSNSLQNTRIISFIIKEFFGGDILKIQGNQDSYYINRINNYLYSPYLDFKKSIDSYKIYKVEYENSEDIVTHPLYVDIYRYLSHTLFFKSI